MAIVIRALCLYELISEARYGVTIDEIAARFPSWYGDRDFSKKSAGYRKLYRDLGLLEEAAPIVSVLRYGDSQETVYIHARNAHRIEGESDHG